MQCPACTADLPEEDLFCESCGVALRGDSAVPPMAGAGCVCGAAAGENDQDGYCLRCGRRVVRPASDHIEASLSPHFAAVSDRGLRHDRNEDRFSIFQAGAWYGMVVCDGVSSTRRSEVASAAVSEGAAASLAKAVAGEDSLDLEAEVRRAIEAEAAKLSAQSQPGKDGSENLPSTTVVAALVSDKEMIIGWVGDSRAYWVDADGATLLTRDHSWLNEAIGNGGITMEQALASPRAHAITRWVGADAGPDSVPETMRRAIAGPGTVLLCTDGLWNYLRADDVTADEELATLMAAAGEDTLSISRELVRFANGRGGQDNITVALLRVDGIKRVD